MYDDSPQSYGTKEEGSGPLGDHTNGGLRTTNYGIMSIYLHVYIYICACIMVKKHVFMIINKCSKVGDGEQN